MNTDTLHRPSRSGSHDDVLAELYAVREQMAKEAGNNADVLFSILRQRHELARAGDLNSAPVYLKLNKRIASQ